MTSARQRHGKHIPEVTLSTTEGSLKVGILKSEQTFSAGQRLARARLSWDYTRLRHNAYMNNSIGTLEGGDFYPVLPMLKKDTRPG
jgi:hypothetical protein